MKVATGLMYQPSITVLSHYFEKRRALAMGISTSGASLGGVLYPSKHIPMWNLAQIFFRLTSLQPQFS